MFGICVASGIVEPVSKGQGSKDYLTRSVTPTLLKGLTELCKKKPADPIVSQTCNSTDKSNNATTITTMT